MDIKVQNFVTENYQDLYVSDDEIEGDAQNQNQIKLQQHPRYKIQKVQGKESQIFDHNDTIRLVYFSPCGTLFAAISYFNQMISIYRTKDSRLLHVYQGEQNAFLQMSLSQDGILMATSSYDKTINIFNLQTGKQVSKLMHHTDHVMSLIFHKTGKYLISGDNNGEVVVWSMEKFQILQTLPRFDDSINYMLISDDSGQLAISTGDYDIETYLEQQNCQQKKNNGENRKSSNYSTKPDKYFEKKSQQKLSLKPVEKKLLKYSPLIFLYHMVDSNIEINNTNSSYLLQGHTKQITTLAYPPNSYDTLVSGSLDGSIICWDTKKSEQLWVIQQAHVNGINQVVFGKQDQNYIFSVGGDIKVYMRDSLTGEIITTLSKHTKQVNSIAISPEDDNYIVTGSDDQSFIVWKKQQNGQNQDDGEEEEEMTQPNQTKKQQNFIEKDYTENSQNSKKSPKQDKNNQRRDRKQAKKVQLII